MLGHLMAESRILGIPRGVREIISGRLSNGQLVNPSAAPPERSSAIERRVGGHPVDKGRKTSLTTKTTAMAVKTQKSLLGHIFRFLTGPHHPHQKPENTLLMTLNQRFEGIIVPGLPAGYQIRIGILDHNAATGRSP
jgi:hypothetical protein